MAVSSITAELIAYLKNHPDAFYSLRPRQFEELVAEALVGFGWEVQLTRPTKDGGFDIFAVSKPDDAGVTSSWIPVETLEPLAELFRHRFIATLLDKKIISERKSRQLLSWKHSGFSIDAGDRPVRGVAGRQQLAEYLLRAPFSLEKITWVEKTKRVIYRSGRSWRPGASPR